MKTSDIVRIIETCSKNNVSDFRFKELALTFHRKEPEPEKLAEFGPTPAAAIPKSEDDEKDRVSDLLISNPLEMEQRIAAGELVDAEED